MLGALSMRGRRNRCDVTPGFVGIRVFSARLSSRLHRTILSSKPFCHFSAFLGNALLISHYPIGDTTHLRRGARFNHSELLRNVYPAVEKLRTQSHPACARSSRWSRFSFYHNTFVILQFNIDEKKREITLAST